MGVASRQQELGSPIHAGLGAVVTEAEIVDVVTKRDAAKLAAYAAHSSANSSACSSTVRVACSCLSGG